MVGQLAKQAGLRVIGVAGGEEKCRMAVETFGFDACIDHRGKDAKAMREALVAECPDGIDIYFENVGGPTLGGVIPLLNLHARVIICGMIAWYSGESDETGSMPLQKLWRYALVKRITIQGLLQTDHVARFGARGRTQGRLRRNQVRRGCGRGAGERAAGLHGSAEGQEPWQAGREGRLTLTEGTGP